MSGFQGANQAEGGAGFATLGTGALGSELTKLLLVDAIVPGSPPSYAACKTIYSYHPLGAKMAEAPITMAMSQDREITVPGGPESRLIPAFEREWRSLGGIGADAIIAQTMTLARIYGTATVVVGDRKHGSEEPLPLDRLHELDLHFNVLDPLNTAGSLVLSQDPNAPDFLKPSQVRVAGRIYHPSRSIVMMNERPIYIEFTPSAFGFVGRSVYQRAFYALKSYLQTMITDQMVAQKVGLLVAKMKMPGSIANNIMALMAGFKRQQLQSGATGNVLQVGDTDSIESLNLQNLEGAGRFARENIIKNIASAGGMPAQMLNEETLAADMHDGTEDAKRVARYIDRMRIEMQPLYNFFDPIARRRAWSPQFYKTIQRQYSEYENVPYETAFYQWSNDFTAIWPNLLVEPDSEKAKVADVRFKSVVALIETLAPLVQDQANKTRLVMWAADQVAEQKDLFSSPLAFDEDAMLSYEPPATAGANSPTSGEEMREREPTPYSYET